MNVGTWLPYWGLGIIVKEGEEHEQAVVASWVEDILRT
jgi:hypothetical protein